ncbi:phosphatidylinositol mannoside acyltransferase [Actinopolymorpha sp. NPDC004070]|uniref:phosphatidylinositol mannoside acyltransferase n=1 Tax=Actinopolymorpha sp. NPDC004070 TaxID=3154548 RepID=UPI0033A13DA6
MIAAGRPAAEDSGRDRPLTDSHRADSRTTGGRTADAPTGRPSLPLRLKYAASYRAYAAGWKVLRLLPAPAAYGLLRLGADLVWRRRPKGVRRLERNLARVRPDATPEELRRLSRAGMRSYFRYWCEAFRLPDLGPDHIRGAVVTHGEDAFWEAMRSGNGVVAPLPHMGNWDFAGAWAAANGAPVTTVAERVRPERLYDRFVAYRAALGIQVLAATGGPDPMGVLAERLREGGLVCLVADRDLSARGVEVEFFGERTRMPAGPAALALRTGATLLPVTLWYDGPTMHVRFHPAVAKPPGSRQAIRDLTQQVADAFAAGIAEHPQDWHMLQRLWIADLEPARRADLDRRR